MPEPIVFENVALYRSGMFGVSRIDCKTLTILTGQKYAQYNDAIRYQLLEKGRRKLSSYVMADSSPWMRVLSLAEAIEPDDPMQDNGAGSRVSKYPSCDPRYITDFEERLGGAAILFSVGYGERDIMGQSQPNENLRETLHPYQDEGKWRKAIEDARLKIGEHQRKISSLQRAIKIMKGQIMAQEPWPTRPPR